MERVYLTIDQVKLLLKNHEIVDLKARAILCDVFEYLNEQNT